MLDTLTVMISADHQNKNKMSYRPDIDGLRAIAIVSVVLYHAFPALVPGGFVGVDVFFVISGYLISGLIFEAVEGRQFSFGDFYARRIRRIFPALIVVLGAVYAFGYLTLRADEMERLGKHIAAGAGFASNFVLWHEAGYFDISAEAKPLLHLWSLGIEEQFYLFWPMFVYGAYRLRLGGFWPATGILLLSFSLCAYQTHTDPVAAFYSPATRMWELMAGGILAHLALHSAGRGPPNPIWSNARSAVGVAVLGCAIALIDSNRQFPGWWALLPATGTMLVISAGSQAWLNKHVLSAKIAVWVGLISYPLYLWHWPILSYSRILHSRGLPLAWLLIAIATSVVLAALTYWFVERPLRFGLPFGRSRQVLVAVLCTLMIAVGLAGRYAFRHHGLEYRDANAAVRAATERYGEDFKTKDIIWRNDNTCRQLLGISPLKNEYCAATSAEPDILIMGDSHAISLNSAIRMHRVRLNAIVVAEEGCLPFETPMNHGPSDPARDKNCAQISEHGLEIARRFESIQTVILNSRDTVYLANRFSGPDDETDRRLYDWLPDGSGGFVLDNARSLVKGYGTLIETFHAMGKHVVLVLDNPALITFDVAACVFPRRNQTPVCSLPRSIVTAYEADYRELLKQIRDLHPYVDVIDTTPLFCDAESCFAKDDWHLYYFDQNHLSISGSEKVLRAILGHLKGKG